MHSCFKTAHLFCYDLSKEIWRKGVCDAWCLLSKPKIYRPKLERRITLYISIYSVLYSNMYISWLVYFVTGLSYVLLQSTTARLAKLKADIAKKNSHSYLSRWIRRYTWILKLAILIIIFLFQIHNLCYEIEGPSSLQMKKQCDDMFWWNIMQLCPPSYTPLFKIG